jgi:hypothetical protein
MTHDDHNCCCHDKDHKHEHGHDWEEHMKNMSKEELMMKKEKLEKKLAMVNELLQSKE